MIYDDDFVLLETNGKHVLIDNRVQSIYLLNNNLFEILQALKSISVKKTEDYFGKKAVQKAMDFIAALKSDRDCFSKSCSGGTAEFMLSHPCITEGVFMIAQKCNMKCKYCFGGEGQYGSKSIMTRTMARQCLIRFIEMSRKATTQRIVFLGGEPLLNFDVMKYVVEMWKELQNNYPQKTIRFAFTTNGTMFKPDIIEFIKDNQIGVTISLDGPEEIQNKNRAFNNSRDTYKSVIAGIKMLEDANIDYSVRATITSDSDIERIYSYFEKCNFTNTHIIPVDFPIKKKKELYQWNIDQYKELKNREKKILCSGYLDIVGGKMNSFQAKQMLNVYDEMDMRVSKYPFKCSAGWWSVTFSSDGNIYPCHRLVGNQKYQIGDVYNGLDINRIRHMFNQALKQSARCETCEAFIFCKRRCFGQMDFENDDAQMIPEELCEIYKDEFVTKLGLFLELKKRI